MSDEGQLGLNNYRITALETVAGYRGGGDLLKRRPIAGDGSSNNLTAGQGTPQLGRPEMLCF